MLSKFSGGIGLAYSRVRSRGSHIKSTNGLSNGIIPWLKTLDASVAAVNQGGKEKVHVVYTLSLGMRIFLSSWSFATTQEMKQEEHTTSILPTGSATCS